MYLSFQNMLQGPCLGNYHSQFQFVFSVYYCLYVVLKVTKGKLLGTSTRNSDVSWSYSFLLTFYLTKKQSLWCWFVIGASSCSFIEAATHENSRISKINPGLKCNIKVYKLGFVWGEWSVRNLLLKWSVGVVTGKW